MIIKFTCNIYFQKLTKDSSGLPEDDVEPYLDTPINKDTGFMMGNFGPAKGLYEVPFFSWINSGVRKMRAPD